MPEKTTLESQTRNQSPRGEQTMSPLPRTPVLLSIKHPKLKKLKLQREISDHTDLDNLMMHLSEMQKDFAKLSADAAEAKKSLCACCIDMRFSCVSSCLKKGGKEDNRAETNGGEEVKRTPSVRKRNLSMDV